MSFEHAIHEARVNTIYKVAKLKRECAYSDFNMEIKRLYEAAKCYPPDSIILTYTDVCEGKVRLSLKETGEQDKCKTIKAVVAVGSCVQQGRNDPDRPGLVEILCLGHHKPTDLLVGRGNIFSKDSSAQILCRRTSDLMNELLK